MSCLIVCRLYSFTPHTPLERRAGRDPKDPKNNMSIARSDALSDFDPSELTFAQSQHNLNLNNLNTSTPSTSSVLSTGSDTSLILQNSNTLGASVQRRDYTVHCNTGILEVQQNAFSTIAIRVRTCTLSSPQRLPGP